MPAGRERRGAIDPLRLEVRQAPPLRQLPGSALRAVLAEGYSATDLRHDVLAGVVVGIVALPLAGLREQPASVLKKAGVQEEVGRLHIVPTLEDAAADAVAYLQVPQSLLNPHATGSLQATNRPPNG